MIHYRKMTVTKKSLCRLQERRTRRGQLVKLSDRLRAVASCVCVPETIRNETVCFCVVEREMKTCRPHNHGSHGLPSMAEPPPPGWQGVASMADKEQLSTAV